MFLAVVFLCGPLCEAASGTPVAADTMGPPAVEPPQEQLVVDRRPGAADLREHAAEGDRLHGIVALQHRLRQLRQLCERPQQRWPLHQRSRGVSGRAHHSAIGTGLISDRSLQAAAVTADIGVAHMRIAAAAPSQTGTMIFAASHENLMSRFFWFGSPQEAETSTATP